MSRTFAEAKKTLLEDFARAGWQVKAGLKVPHATSPDGVVRFWFKPQAIHYSVVMGRAGSHELQHARTLSYDQDMRKMTIDDIIAHVKL